MASLRRTLSPRTCEMKASGGKKSAGGSPPQPLLPSPPLAPENAAAAAAAQRAISLVLFALLRVSGGAKASPWRKFLLQFGVCFSLGLCLGFFTPYKWPAPAAGALDSLAAVEAEKIFVGDLRDGARQRSIGLSAANSWEEMTGAAKARDAVVGGLSGPDAAALTPRKLLIVVTPTYTRPFKAYYLTRLAHTLRLVPPPLLWLVVETHVQSLETAALLRETGLMYRHLVSEHNLTDVKDRGTHQRNAALAHIEQHQLDGVVYFADDDNVYTLELFEQLRLIKRFGTWPVGMLAHGKSRTILEGPVCDGEKVVGWHTNEKSKRLRRFHVDMSGFAFNSTILWDPRRWRRPTLEPIRQLDTIKEGFQETTFIEQLVADESQMEGRPPGCSKVMVWHLHLEAPPGFPYPPSWTLRTPLQANLPLRHDS